MKKQKYAWVTVAPTVFLLITCLTAGWQKIFHENPAIGFLAQAHKYSAAIAKGEVLKPAKTLDEMQTIVFSNYVDAVLCGFFMIVMIVMIFGTIRALTKALASDKPTVVEGEAIYEDPKPLNISAPH